MSRFLETICIKDGVPMHLPWHQRRVDATLQHFYPREYSTNEAFPLFDILLSCQFPTSGAYRCRIEYDLNTLAVEFFPYERRTVTSLKLVEAPGEFDYQYKFSDRKMIDDLFALRGDADDILITRDDWIMDTSIANIAFRKEDRWYSPAIPLLAGTTWKRLIANGMLIPRPIHRDDLKAYDAFCVFNAMVDFGEVEGSTDSIE